MELARYIREENLGNRLKLRQREHILYGKESPLPLYEEHGEWRGASRQCHKRF